MGFEGTKYLGRSQGGERQERIGASLLLAAATADAVATVTEKVAADPPRPDIDVPTHERRSRIGTELDIDDPVARAALRLTAHLDNFDAGLTAFLRSYERLLGAIERDRPDAAAARTGEVRRFAQLSAARGLAASGSARSLGVLWEGEDMPEDQWRDQRKPRTSRELPESVLALLYLSGLPLGRFERTLTQPRRSVPVPRQALSDLADSLEALSARLPQWDEEPVA